MKKIPKEALDFLLQLEKNNNRDWFDEHKPKFKALEKEMKFFYQEIESLLNNHDQKPKRFVFTAMCVFLMIKLRINLILPLVLPEPNLHYVEVIIYI